MEPRPGCPITAAADVLGDRWTLLILRDLIYEDRRNFRALLLGSAEGIASNILAARLVRLVEAGVLTRGAGRRGQRAQYSLTEAGIQVVPVLEVLADWGRAWGPPTEATDGSDASGAVDAPASAADLMADLRLRHLGPDATAP